MSRIAGYDSHNHPLYFGIFSNAFDLAKLEKQEALAQIKGGGYNLVINWDNSRWALAPEDIEANFPITVFNASFHGIVMNKTAQRKYRLQPDSSGLIADSTRVATFVDKLVKEFSKEDFKKAILKAQEEYLRLGLYGVDDMGMRAVSLAPFQALKELRDEDKLRLEVNTFFRYSVLRNVANNTPDLLNLCAGLKIIADGAFGVWTAAISQPYNGQPDNYGSLYIHPESLNNQILYALHLGICTIAVHCIGDRGIDIVLGAYQVLARLGKDTAGWRLEHAILITPDQARKAKKLGVVLSMQPNFSSDVRYKDRLGERVAQINNFRMLIDEVGFEPGKDLILGSDGMPTGLEKGLEWATQAPMFESQRLTKEEARKGYRVKPLKE